MDALNLTIESKSSQVEELKNSVVEAEIKSRKAVDRLNKIQAGEAQENIDKSLNFLNQMGIREPKRAQQMEDQGVLTNSDNRLNSYMPDKLTLLTPETALAQLKVKNKAQPFTTFKDDMSMSSYSFQDSHNQARPAQLLQQSLDHSNWQTPGIGGNAQARPKS